ncbi:MAG: DUF4007 family protein [Armatimonadia bacterium]
MGEEGPGSTAVETAIAPSSAEVAVYEGDTPFFPVGLCTTVYLPLAAAAGKPRPGADEMIIADSNETTQGKVSYRFSGHQTFAFRYGWLEKGVRGVEQRATIFSDEDALVHLGVGKNMVQSIRHWCTVTQLIEPVPGAPRGKAQPLQPTPMARLLLLPEGWDPFLEDDASLWLIHWMLVSNPSVCTTWQLLFCHYHRPDFTRREAVDHLASVAEKGALKVARSSLSRDFDCFLRTYAAPRAEIGEALPEESFDCPLLSLRLIQPSADGDLYAFGIGPKPSLPAPVFAFALDQHFSRTRETQSTLGIQQCLYGKGSPGQAFKLDENSLIEYVEELEELTDGAVSVDETAGLKQIYRRREFDALALLDRYFGAGNGS